MEGLTLEDIKIEENFIRDNLYNPQYKDHEMNTNPYYGLIEITEEIWNYICSQIMSLKEDPYLYFPNSRMNLRKLITRSWEDINRLANENNIEKYFGDNSDNVYLAGGRALAVLLTVPHNDTDYFTTVEIKPEEINNPANKILVSPQVIGFGIKTQLIKRLYKNPHEIVHSFDIDCCAVLINKHGQIFGSKRFLYALLNGCNTIDFDYFSPSYEWRLMKYSNRGFSVNIPGVINCPDPNSLLQQTDEGLCIPDNIWSYADIDDILNGTMLRSLLINAKGFQRLLIASSIMKINKDIETNKRQYFRTRYLRKLSGEQLSDYEEKTETTNTVSGKYHNFILNGNIGYNENGQPISYQGTMEKLESEDIKIRDFSNNFIQILDNIFNSPYKTVKPGEQTTSTFHKIVLENPDEWYKLDKRQLFEDSLHTFLYFKRVSYPPSLFDIKVKWFGDDCIDLWVYHFARLFLNNKIYNIIGPDRNIEVTNLKISFGNYIPHKLKYNGKEYDIINGSEKGVLTSLMNIHKENHIFDEKEEELLLSLIIRADDKKIPKIETRDIID